MLAALPPPPGHQGHAGIFVPDAWASLSTTGIAWRGVGGDLADDVAGEGGGEGGGGSFGREQRWSQTIRSHGLKLPTQRW